MAKQVIGQRFAQRKPPDPTFGPGLSFSRPGITFLIWVPQEQDYDESVRLGILVKAGDRKEGRFIDPSIRFPLLQLIQGRLFDLEYFYPALGDDEAGTFGDTFRNVLQSLLEQEVQLHFERKFHSIGVVITCGKSKFEYDFSDEDNVDDLFTVIDDDD